jgi:hypothetical protein
MKNENRSGRRDRRTGPPPVVRHCPGCGAEFVSKFAAKHHICRPREKVDA